MDYFDDLDQEALDAFGELNDDSALPSPVEISSKKKQILQSTLNGQESFTYPPEPKRNSRTMHYLFKISSPITPAILASSAFLSSQPNFISGEGKFGVTQFCQVAESDITHIKSWLATTYPSYSPTFVPINKAFKELSTSSIYPTLGLDTTLPHLRPHTVTNVQFLPTQSQYPVWYFFYGTLADSSFLAELFCSPSGDSPKLFPATIRDGKLRTWGRKYNALVDSPGSQLRGWAYEVKSRDEEDALRVYETAKYEVVRVAISLEERVNSWKTVQGCTFRFAGQMDELG
ncbi:hypothetical protein NX059_005892 [Plenodomus lindquistii]|nr:hypothetical protein NX059_005892 [Plenodomus lindquistii]